MQIYNTLSGQKEELRKTGQRIKTFVCGPTVYDYAHIGHAKNYLTFDIIVRYLRSLGYKIFYLQNITDVDDKIIKRANETNENPLKLAARFAELYLEDMRTLGVTSVTRYARATKFIKQIVKQVATLIKKGYAYKISDGWYFDISKFKEYGKLSRRTAEQAEDSVTRIDESVGKRNKGDFCLWKFRKGDEPSWRTELGEGRPGWHIEDTAISEYYFGPQYDIHGGGLDLKFPHHEAELAQQEAASGQKPFVKLWMHSGLLYINGQKMSKSIGNFITIRDFLKKCPPEILRYIVLMHHYRSPINYTDSLFSQASQSLAHIKEFVAKLHFVGTKRKRREMAPPRDMASLIGEIDRRFRGAMADDFNTPKALAAIFDFISLIQPKIWMMPSGDAKTAARYVEKTFAVFGLDICPPKIGKDAARLIAAREEARVHKQFIQSDVLRKRIESLGYKVEDTPLGQFVISS